MVPIGTVIFMGMGRLRGYLVGTAVVALLGATATGGAAPSGRAGSLGSGTTHAGHTGHDKHAGAPPATPLRAGERFVDLTMPRPYQPAPPNGGNDEYRCFLVD